MQILKKTQGIDFSAKKSGMLGQAEISLIDVKSGRVYRFYIYDTVNDEYVCDLLPTWDNVNNRTALKDIINNVVYTPSKYTT